MNKVKKKPPKLAVFRMRLVSNLLMRTQRLSTAVGKRAKVGKKVKSCKTHGVLSNKMT